MEDLVSVKWLVDHISNLDVIVLDASIKSSISPYTAENFEETIPNSRYADLKNSFVDKDASLPNTLPSPEQFEIACQQLGVDSDSKVVVFDNMGIYSSPRLWWLFKIMGHDEVAVLDGGLPEWKNKGHGTTDRTYGTTYRKGNFMSKFRSKYLATLLDVKKATEDHSYLIIDARSKGRFTGTAPEPRKELRSGSIPNSKNLPFLEVLKDRKFKEKSELQTTFNEKYNGNQKLIFSCGSGLSACIILLAHSIAYPGVEVSLYDGSWTEWVKNQGLTRTIDD